MLNIILEHIPQTTCLSHPYFLKLPQLSTRLCGVWCVRELERDGVYKQKRVNGGMKYVFCIHINKYSVLSVYQMTFGLMHSVFYEISWKNIGFS